MLLSRCYFRLSVHACMSETSINSKNCHFVAEKGSFFLDATYNNITEQWLRLSDNELIEIPNQV